MGSWHSYGAIYNLGHRALTSLFDGPVVVEEKIDGSQFSFGVFDGILRCRSKGAELNLVAPEKMFAPGIATAQRLGATGLLVEGWTYRGEYLAKPKHNTLVYDRVPAGHIILFDIATDEECYLGPDAKRIAAHWLGLEVVPVLYHGPLDDVAIFRAMLETPSVLGGQKIEGVVVKNYGQFGPDKKTLMGKFVSEAFKEVHGGEWRANNPTSGDIVQALIEKFKTPARWQKALQHLTERGEIVGDPRDIGILMKEVPLDVEKEERAAIMEALYEYAWPKVRRGLTSGLPEWYKQRLLEQQFQVAPDAATA